jgi:hypothetical protein
MTYTSFGEMVSPLSTSLKKEKKEKKKKKKKQWFGGGGCGLLRLPHF